MMQHSSKQQGFVMVLVIVLSATFLAIGLTLADLVASRYQSSKRTTYVENAILAADAGVTDTLDRVLIESNFTGYSTKKQLYSDAARGKADYTTTIAYDITQKLYTITSTGHAYRASADTEPANTKKVEVTASLANSSAPARIAAGPGGLVINNGATLGGKNIWVNGKVQVNNGKVGNTTFDIFGPNADVTLNAANIGCSSGGSYPVKCTGPMPGSGEPIQIASGSNGIFGTVCASGQTTSTGIYPGMNGKGLIFNCDASSVFLPEYDRREIYDSMTQTLPGFTCENWAFQGNPPHDLEAKTIYNGNVKLTMGFGNCNSTIKGDVYIRGNLTVGGFGMNMTVADNDPLGNPITTPPIIAVEGNVTFENTWSDIIPNNRGVGPIFISYKSNNVACNSNPDCNSLTPTDLFNSVNLETVALTGGNFGAVSSTFYSYFGTVNIAGGSVGAVSGQRIVISSNGDVYNYLQGGVNKDSFPSGDAFNNRVKLAIWNIVNYRQIFP